MKSGFVSRQHSGRPALLVEGGETLAYAGLHEAIEDFAQHLSPGQLVFIVGGNDLPTVLCYLASLERRAVPLLLRAGIDEAQLDRLVSAYDPAFVFMPSEASWSKAGCTLLKQDGAYGLYSRATSAAAGLHDSLALLLTTSGSTGSPKLVRLTADNLKANAAAIAAYLDITADERTITTLPFNYSYGLSVINSHLYAGASIVLSNRSLMDAAFWRLVNDHRVSSFAGVPYTYEMLLKLRMERITMPSVRTLTLAGGRMELAKLTRVAEICRNRGIRFVPMYGQTEATARIAWLAHDEVERKAGSIGRPVPGGRLWLEDDAGKPVTEAGVVGELVYSGPNVSMGYAERLDDLKLGDVNQGVLRTGDLARFDEDGYFFIEGRLRRFLKIFGIRISLDGVEQIAAEKGFACAAVGNDDQLIMHVVETPQLTPEAIRADMAQTLGLHPSAITVKPLRELPRLPTGKVNYQCLNPLS